METHQDSVSANSLDFRDEPLYTKSVTGETLLVWTHFYKVETLLDRAFGASRGLEDSVKTSNRLRPGITIILGLGLCVILTMELALDGFV